MAGSWRGGRGRSLGRRQLLDADVAVADELLGEVAAAVDLEGDAALVHALDLVLVFHELDALDPRRDLRRVALDPRLQLVPLAVLPERRPLLRLDGQLELAL